MNKQANEGAEPEITEQNPSEPRWRSWAWIGNHTPLWWGEPLDDVAEEGLLPKEQAGQIGDYLYRYVTDFFEALEDDRREMDEIWGVYEYVEKYLQEHMPPEAWRMIQERDAEMGGMIY
jgi:hypothetical protein